MMAKWHFPIIYNYLMSSLFRQQMRFQVCAIPFICNLQHFFHTGGGGARLQQRLVLVSYIYDSPIYDITSGCKVCKVAALFWREAPRWTPDAIWFLCYFNPQKNNTKSSLFGHEIGLKGRLYTFSTFSAFKTHNSVSLWVKITRKPNSIGRPSLCLARKQISNSATGCDVINRWIIDIRNFAKSRVPTPFHTNNIVKVNTVIFVFVSRKGINLL